MNDSSNNIHDTVAALAALEPGKLPLEIFNQIARLTVTPVVEIIPFYLDKNRELKVFLLQRGEDDVLWPGMHHVPGGIVLATDTPGSFSDALKRILDSKLTAYQPSKPVLIDPQLCRVSRGTEVAIIYTVTLASMPDTASLFDPNNLPANMIEGQAGFIQAALEKFGKS